MPRRWILLLTLAGSFLLVYLLWRSPPAELNELFNSHKQKADFPSSFLKNAHTRQYDEQGRLDYSLTADTINYYENVGAQKPDTIMEQPYFTLYDYNETNREVSAISTISANMAEGNEKKDELTLMGDVIIKQVAINKKDRRESETSELKTELLFIQPNRRYAETDKPVIITSKAGTTTATGLKVFFNEKRIELLSDVKGQYAPQ